MEGAVGAIDAEAVAQRVERIALAGVHQLGHGQRVGHFGNEGAQGRQARALEFLVEEPDVECRVVDDQLGAAQVLDDVVAQRGELRLVAQEIRRQPVHLERIFMALALGVEVDVQVVAGELSGEQLHAAELDDAVAVLGGKPGGFGVKDDLTTHACPQSRHVVSSPPPKGVRACLGRPGAALISGFPWRD